jgi:hypothetical protein
VGFDLVVFRGSVGEVGDGSSCVGWGYQDFDQCINGSVPSRGL